MNRLPLLLMLLLVLLLPPGCRKRLASTNSTRPSGCGSASSDPSGLAISSLSSQCSHALLARSRLRHAVSEMSASPISTAQAPSRRVDSAPRT